MRAKKEENFLFAVFGVLAFWLGQLVLVFKMNMLFFRLCCVFFSAACVLRIAYFSMHCILFSVHVTVFFFCFCQPKCIVECSQIVHTTNFLYAVLCCAHIWICYAQCTWWKTSFGSAFKCNRQTEFSFCYKNGQFEHFRRPILTMSRCTNWKCVDVLDAVIYVCVLYGVCCYVYA